MPENLQQIAIYAASNVVTTEWKSREKTLVKIIEQRSASGNREYIVVLGTDATGWGNAINVRGSLFTTRMREECTDAAEKLPKTVIDDVVRIPYP